MTASSFLWWKRQESPGTHPRYTDLCFPPSIFRPSSPHTRIPSRSPDWHALIFGPQRRRSFWGQLLCLIDALSVPRDARKHTPQEVQAVYLPPALTFLHHPAKLRARVRGLHGVRRGALQPRPEQGARPGGGDATLGVEPPRPDVPKVKPWRRGGIEWSRGCLSLHRVLKRIGRVVDCRQCWRNFEPVRRMK